MPGRLAVLRSAWARTEILGNPVKRASTVSAWSAHKVGDLVVDRYYRMSGMDTRGPAFGPDPRDGLLGYVPSDWSILRKIFPRGSVASDDVLLEYGSGKGRAVLWLSTRFGLRRAIGVERDPDLHRAAERNLQTWRGGELSGTVTLVCADARGYEVPDDVTLIYLFNPFMDEVFDAVLTNIQQSLERRPRTLRIAYLYPIMHNSLLEAGFRPEEFHRHLFRAWATYRTIATG